MCSCDESATSWPTCLRHAPRTLVGHTDFRYVSLQELCDVGEWTEQEAEGSRREQALSEVSFKSRFEDAA